MTNNKKTHAERIIKPKVENVNKNTYFNDTFNSVLKAYIDFIALDVIIYINDNFNPKQDIATKSFIICGLTEVKRENYIQYLSNSIPEKLEPKKKEHFKSINQKLLHIRDIIDFNFDINNTVEFEDKVINFRSGFNDTELKEYIKKQNTNPEYIDDKMEDKLKIFKFECSKVFKERLRHHFKKEESFKNLYEYFQKQQQEANMRAR